MGYNNNFDKDLDTTIPLLYSLQFLDLDKLAILNLENSNINKKGIKLLIIS